MEELRKLAIVGLWVLVAGGVLLALPAGRVGTGTVAAGWSRARIAGALIALGALLQIVAQYGAD
jgi:hypothetical protein